MKCTNGMAVFIAQSDESQPVYFTASVHFSMLARIATFVVLMALTFLLLTFLTKLTLRFVIATRLPEFQNVVIHPKGNICLLQRKMEMYSEFHSRILPFEGLTKMGDSAVWRG